MIKGLLPRLGGAMMSVLGLSLALLIPAAHVAGPCDLLDPATVSELLGQPLTKGAPSGPEPDEDSGGTLGYCTYRAGSTALIVSQVTFGSAAAARKATTKELVAGRLEDEVIALTEERGLGDKAFWAYTTQGAEYVVLKGPSVLGLALGGRLPKPPASYQAALRAAAAGAIAKL
jgi:hypothetical protein